MLLALSILFGAAVGFALGLTGGGGALLAVPLLVFGLAIAPSEAVGISLAAVGTTALVGVAPRLRAGQVEVGTALLFAAAGMVGAPLGTWIASMIPEATLLTLFAALMLVVAARMWQLSVSLNHCEASSKADREGRSCRRNEQGKLLITSRCARLLAAVGLATGILAGMFGVGGGFVIVPALVLVTAMPMRRAVATSLLVIVLVSVSGVASHVVAGRNISFAVTATFVLGGVIGMALAAALANRLSGPVLQKTFAAGMVGVATFVVGKSLI